MISLVRVVGLIVISLVSLCLIFIVHWLSLILWLGIVLRLSLVLCWLYRRFIWFGIVMIYCLILIIYS